MHFKRWITAIILLPPLVVLILMGGPILFGILVILISMITMWEYYRIVFHDHHPRIPLFYPICGYLNGALMVIAAIYNQPAVLFAPLMINVIGAAFVSLFRFKATNDAPMVVVKQTFGLVYIPLFLACAVLVYHDTAGPLWILFLLGVVAMGDTGAYYVGTYCGRHKLSPAVSPKKSIEGALGGLAANVVFALVFKLFFFNQISLPAILLLAVVAGAVGQVGDLFESEFKRAAGIKDSSNLLPGHGGFLDRIDALLFALPTAYLLKEWLLS
jgi:phosphatidate cytidylyltransferase